MAEDAIREKATQHHSVNLIKYVGSFFQNGVPCQELLLIILLGKAHQQYFCLEGTLAKNSKYEFIKPFQFRTHSIYK